MTPDEARAWTFDLPPLTQGEALEQIDEPAGVQVGDGTAPLIVVPRDEGVGGT